METLWTSIILLVPMCGNMLLKLNGLDGKFQEFFAQKLGYYATTFCQMPPHPHPHPHPKKIKKQKQSSSPRKINRPQFFLEHLETVWRCSCVAPQVVGGGTACVLFAMSTVSETIPLPILTTPLVVFPYLFQFYLPSLHLSQ